MSCRTWLAVSASLLGGLMFLAPARASIIVTLPNSTPTVSGSSYTFSYDADVTNDEVVQTGNYFTIYDVGGFTSATAPANWVATDTLVGLTPPNVVPTIDNPTIENVTFTYTGLSPIAGPQALGVFHVVSAASGVHPGEYASEATAAGTTDLDDLHGHVPVPNVTVGTPEPASGALLALASIGLLTRRRRRA